MATRIEKIFKRTTIQTMNTILNEVNSLVNCKQKTSEKEYKTVLKNISESISGFYEDQNITINEIRKALKKWFIL